MDFNHETRRLFIGMENGQISEFDVAEDYNRITGTRNYIAHIGRINQVVFSLITEWVLSVARDKFFNWFCSETGRRLGGIQLAHPCTALQLV